MSERLCCEGLLSKQDPIEIVSEDKTERLKQSIDDADVSDLGRHIQSCTEMKCMQLLSDGRVTEDQGLLCADLIQLEARIVLWC